MLILIIRMEFNKMNKSKNSNYGKYRVDVNDIIGARFGNLIVVELAGDFRDVYNGAKYYDKHRYLYKCVCDCGKEKLIRRDPLLEGITKSCGCLRKSDRRKGVSKEKYNIYNDSIKMLPKVYL